MSELAGPRRGRVSSFCRFCHNGCPILVDVVDGRVERVTGDRRSSVYQGFTCAKGRALPEQLYHEERLLRSQKRSGVANRHIEIKPDELIREISERLTTIREENGPNAIACYAGTAIVTSPLVQMMTSAFLEGLGSTRMFTSDSIDQPGKQIAKALHGTWQAPGQGFDDPDVALIVGANPLVSFCGGLPTGNPAKWLAQAQQRGLQLLVIDPRRTETARRAALHLQPRPGEDVALLAAMLRVIVTERLFDQQFVATYVDGLELLSESLGPFTVEKAAQQADVAACDIDLAARTFARASRGYAVASTGPNMSGSGTLVEYLVLCLNTLCGRWLRAGEAVRAPATVVHMPPPRAQVTPPFPGFDLGDPLPGTSVRSSIAGNPTGLVPDMILDGGSERIRALISIGGNPALAWPDQAKTAKALQSLDLLVQVDIRMSATAQLAHYVVASKMSLESASVTALQDVFPLYGNAYFGFAEPWAQYTDKIVDPPVGAMVLEEWEFLYRLAQAMGLQLTLGQMLPHVAAQPTVLDMSRVPSTHEMLAWCTAQSRIDFGELTQTDGGALWPTPSVEVQPGDPSAGSFDVGNEHMMRDLRTTAARMTSWESGKQATSLFPFRLICRRAGNAYNSSGHALAGMRGRYFNPAFLHGTDMLEIGLERGDRVTIRSQHGSVRALAEPDDSLRRGVVSMTHCFGGLPDQADDVRALGTPISRLLTASTDLQPYSAQPLMSNIPVAIEIGWP